MKPQPMSDGQIANEWGMALMRHDTTREQLFDFARAIIEERDAQWAAMIGEPVALSIRSGGFLSDATWSPDEPEEIDSAIARIGGDAVKVPLYAIKETP